MLRQFKTILCPTDFSEESHHAIEYGVSFAKLSDGTVLLAHILHNPTSELFHPEGYTLSFEQAKQRAQSLLEQLRDKRLGYPKCDLYVDIGDPYEQLMALAKQRNVDLIVVATHGRSAIGDLVLGSVAEKLIRHSLCPVFVVRRGAF
jgi:Universal stress protein UspA and related nucleotide-binding proteins